VKENPAAEMNRNSNNATKVGKAMIALNGVLKTRTLDCRAIRFEMVLPG
jgi:hypothetical protein